MTDEACEVYWGSHGCMYERGHDGPHECVCTFDNETGERLPHMSETDNGNVGCPPYYGPETLFYGDDARRLGLPGWPEQLAHPDGQEMP